MNFNDYQAEASKTAIFSPDIKIMYPALGLAGEVGEVCNKIKKIFRDDNGIVSEEKRLDIEDELGDVLWYLASVATDLGISLDDSANKNLAKLTDRQSRNVLQGSGDNR